MKKAIEKKKDKGIRKAVRTWNDPMCTPFDKTKGL